jgi:hypothetical protein
MQELLQEQQSICNAREIAQKEMQAQLTAKDADLALQHANVQRLEADLATTKAEAADLQNICNAGETAQKEMQAQLTAKDADLALQHANVQRLEAEQIRVREHDKRERDSDKVCRCFYSLSQKTYNA